MDGTTTKDANTHSPVRKLLMWLLWASLSLLLVQAYLLTVSSRELARTRREVAVYRNLFEEQKSGRLTAPQTNQIVDALQQKDPAFERDVIIVHPSK